jgi:serine/threonine-protein kinase
MATMKDDRAAATAPHSAAPTPLPDGRAPDLSGVVLGNDFLLQRRLGEGGMGQVYLAEQMSLKRRVAIKLLRHELSRDAVSRKRFETEAKAVAQLSHPNIVQVYAVGEQDGLLYMALEYVDGLTLKELLTRKGPLDLPIALSIMRQVAAALVRAAEIGIIHRDIKPENLLITRKVEVKVTDFGLSRIMGYSEGMSLTQTGHAMGTPLYMSPEQVMGQPLDVRTDLYSFGATCYHMLTGQPPFMGETAIAVGFKHVQEEPTPVTHFRPDLPPELGAIISKLMAKRPEDRYQSARELLRDLKRVSELVFGSSSGSGTGLGISGLSSSRLPSAAGPESAVAAKPSDQTTVTVRLPPLDRRQRWQAWMPWILGTSLLVAIATGAVVGQWLKANQMAVTPNGSEHGKPADSPEVISPSVPIIPLPPPPPMRPGQMLMEEERRLRGEIEQTRNLVGKNAPFQLVQRGLNSRAQLAALYIYPPPGSERSQRLDEAERLGREWSSVTVPPYRLLGKWVLVFVQVARGEVKAARDDALRILDEKVEYQLPSALRDSGEDLTRFMIRIPAFNRLLSESLLEMERRLGGPGKLPARLDELLQACRQQIPPRDLRPPRPSRSE